MRTLDWDSFITKCVVIWITTNDVCLVQRFWFCYDAMDEHKDNRKQKW